MLSTVQSDTSEKVDSKLRLGRCHWQPWTPRLTQARCFPRTGHYGAPGGQGRQRCWPQPAVVNAPAWAASRSWKLVYRSQASLSALANGDALSITADCCSTAGTDALPAPWRKWTRLLEDSRSAGRRRPAPRSGPLAFPQGRAVWRQPHGAQDTQTQAVTGAGMDLEPEVLQIAGASSQGAGVCLGGLSPRWRRGAQKSAMSMAATVCVVGQAMESFMAAVVL